MGKSTNKLWIDDLRTPPEGWVWAKTSSEAVEAILSNPKPFDHISFDHDLGGDDTSRSVVLWMCENEGYWSEFASVHSMNPVGREWLRGMIERYSTGRFVNYY